MDRLQGLVDYHPAVTEVCSALGYVPINHTERIGNKKYRRHTASCQRHRGFVGISSRDVSRRDRAGDRRVTARVVED